MMLTGTLAVSPPARGEFTDTMVAAIAGPVSAAAARASTLILTFLSTIVSPCCENAFPDGVRAIVFPGVLVLPRLPGFREDWF
jgi:hypothetical protein